MTLLVIHIILYLTVPDLVTRSSIVLPFQEGDERGISVTFSKTLYMFLVCAHISALWEFGLFKDNLLSLQFLVLRLLPFSFK